MTIGIIGAGAIEATIANSRGPDSLSSCAS
jgi:hypothetical protein